jgi:hypothetical protein
VQSLAHEGVATRVRVYAHSKHELHRSEVTPMSSFAQTFVRISPPFEKLTYDLLVAGCRGEEKHCHGEICIFDDARTVSATTVRVVFWELVV